MRRRGGICGRARTSPDGWHLASDWVIVSAATDLHCRNRGAKGARLAIAALVLWLLTASAGVSLLRSGRAVRDAAAGRAQSAHAADPAQPEDAADPAQPEDSAGSAQPEDAAGSAQPAD